MWIFVKLASAIFLMPFVVVKFFWEMIVVFSTFCACGVIFVRDVIIFCFVGVVALSETIRTCARMCRLGYTFARRPATLYQGARMILGKWITSANCIVVEKIYNPCLHPFRNLTFHLLPSKRKINLTVILRRSIWVWSFRNVLVNWKFRE